MSIIKSLLPGIGVDKTRIQSKRTILPAADVTLTPGDLLGFLIEMNTNAVDRNVTFPNPEDVLGEMPNAAIYDCLGIVIRISPALGIINVTFSGGTNISPRFYKAFIVRITALNPPTYVVVDIGTSSASGSTGDVFKLAS